MEKRRIKKSALFFLFLFFFLVLMGLLYVVYHRQSFNNQIESQERIVKEKISYGVFDSYYNTAREFVSEMSLEEKVGQLFLVRYNADRVEEYKDYYPGGYILFAKDFQYQSKESIRDELSYVQSIEKYQLILGVDEEGGTVTRVSRFRAFRYDSFETPRYYYDQGGYDLLEKMEKEKADLLKEIGINLNLAPVADLSTSVYDFIYPRSFGYDKDLTSEYISKMVSYSINNHINSCLKHFPGYGNNVDTHTGIAIDNRSYENFLENDFKPFEAGINAGVPSILVSHNIVKCMDENLPSSLSEKVILQLRENLGYTGIIMTDDLAMDAVSSYVQDGNAATLAIQAGNDMIITSDFISMRNEIISSVQQGILSTEKIDTAVSRIIAWKYYSGLF